MFILIKDNELIQCGTFPFEGYTKEVELDFDEYENNKDKYLFTGDDFIIDPNYEKKQEEKEKERIANLTCTKRVLVMMLEELGLDYYEQIEPLIKANRQAKLEWELATELLRSNPLIDIIGLQLGITHEQLDRLFQYANGEVDTLEVDNG